MVRLYSKHFHQNIFQTSTNHDLSIKYTWVAVTSRFAKMNESFIGAKEDHDDEDLSQQIATTSAHDHLIHWAVKNHQKSKASKNGKKQMILPKIGLGSHFCDQ